MTHCRRGHEFSDENTYRRPNGVRECLKCRARRQRDYVEKQREAWRKYRRKQYQLNMSSPEGRWFERSHSIRAEMAQRKREIDAKQRTVLTFDQILNMALAEGA